MKVILVMVGLSCIIGGCEGFPGQMTDNQAISTLPSGTPTRPIQHAMGITQVPIQPKRVVVLDTAALDSAISLGIKPVGTIFFQRPPAYLGDKVQGIDVIGLDNNPNLEKVLSLKPDLILGNKISSERHYGKLSRSAPTVLTEGSGRSGEWQKNFQLYAEAMGRSQAAKTLLQQYQQQATTLKQQIAKQYQPSPITSVVATGNKQIGAYTRRSFSGSVLVDVGLARPPAQENSERWAIQVSQENFPSLDGDVMFLIEASGIPNSLNLQSFKADPVFSQLNVVKQGRVYPVKAEVWTAGRSILAANEILNDISQYLLNPGNKK